MNTTVLNIADPCPADWGAMTGCESKRFCSQCTKQVHDLSAMTRKQVEILVSGEDNLCVRYTLRPDGEIEFSEPVARGRRLALRAAIGAVLLATTPALAAGIPKDTDKPGLLDRVIEQVRGFFEAEEDPAPVGCTKPVASTQTIPELDNPVLPAPPVVTPVERILMGEIAYEPPPPVRLGKIAPPR